MIFGSNDDVKSGASGGFYIGVLCWVFGMRIDDLLEGMAYVDQWAVGLLVFVAMFVSLDWVVFRGLPAVQRNLWRQE